MNYNDILEENRKLREEILKLKEENRKLKIILEQSTTINEEVKPAVKIDTYDQNHGVIYVTKDSSIEDKLKFYKSLFQGREDVFALRWESKDGKRVGYSPKCTNEWKAGVCDKKKIPCDKCKYRNLKSLTDEDIKKHFSGTHTIGIYPLLIGDMCNFFVIDFDDENWKKDVKAVFESFKKFGLCPSIEISRSGNGAHLWIFFEGPISAYKARYLGSLLMKYTMKQNIGISLDSYDRFFPNQDKMPKGNFGNLIALPLQRIPAKEGYSLFVDEDFNYYSDQWVYLSSIKKNKSLKVVKVIEELETESSEAENNILMKENKGTYFKGSNRALNSLGYEGKVHLLLAAGIIIDIKELPRELLNELRNMAMFSNPDFYRRQALRLYVGKTPRNIKCFDETEKYIIMPRGCFEEIVELFEKCNIEYEIKDERITGEKIDVEFKGRLYENQSRALNEILKHDRGVLYASTAFGKTVVAIAVIASRKINTLIIVNSIELLEQWKAKIEVFLDLGERKVGRFGAGRKKASGSIDVATIQTLNKVENLEEILGPYGQIVIDECHHIAAFTFERVLKQCKAKYVLGLTATIKRKDSLEVIVEFQCGKISYTAVNKNSNEDKLCYILEPRKVLLNIENYNKESFIISDYYELIQKDENRNQMIFEDVMQAASKGRNPIVLTERLEHLELLEKLFIKAFDRVVVLRGGMGKKQRQEAFNKLRNFGEKDNFILISTGKYIGEGFDNIHLDTLFLTMPISWEGTLKQYAGRLHRTCKGKDSVKIYDYIDENVEELLRMYKKRQKGYKNMGYALEENAVIQYEFNC